jgi:hypothetical protein
MGGGGGAIEIFSVILFGVLAFLNEPMTMRMTLMLLTLMLLK